MHTKTRSVEIGRINSLTLSTASQLARMAPEYAATQFGTTREVAVLIGNQDDDKLKSVSSVFRHSLVSIRDSDDMWNRLLMDENEEGSFQTTVEFQQSVQRLNSLAMLVVRERARENPAVAAAQFFTGEDVVRRFADMSYEQVIEMASRVYRPVVTLVDAGTDMWRRLLQVEPTHEYAIGMLTDHLRIKGLTASAPKGGDVRLGPKNTIPRYK